MIKIKLLLLLFFQFIVISDFFAQETKGEYFIACVGYYNLENLFDTIDSPDVDDTEFTPEGESKWNTKRYYKKLEYLSEVIYGIGTDINPDGLAVLGFSEVENRSVVEDLVSSAKLKSRNYEIIHFESPDRRGIDVGLLYQPKYFNPVSNKSIPLIAENNPDFKSRDQLLVTGTMANETIHIIVVHWPSRYGGEKRSQPYRFAAAKLTRSICDSLFKIDPEAKIIVMGDFNDNPKDKSIKQYLKASGRISEKDSKSLFNPMSELYKKGIGTTAWRDSWSLFDQIIISKALTGKDYSSLRMFKTLVYNKKFLSQDEGRYEGYPWRTFAGGVYLGGYSDHFPVYMYLIREL